MPRSPSEIEISLDTMPQMPTAMAYGVTCLPPVGEEVLVLLFADVDAAAAAADEHAGAAARAARRPASRHASRAAMTPNSAAREYRFGSARPSCSSSPSSAGASSIETGGTHAATWQG